MIDEPKRHQTSMLTARMSLVFMAALSLYAPAEKVFSFEPPKMSLEQKVAKSSLVFIGVIKDSDYRDARTVSNEKVALVHVEQVLKGAAKGGVPVIYRNGIAELRLDCCVKGGRYLFFLEKDHRGLFASVSGADGVYRIDVPPVP